MLLHFNKKRKVAIAADDKKSKSEPKESRSPGNLLGLRQWCTRTVPPRLQTARHPTPLHQGPQTIEHTSVIYHQEQVTIYRNTKSSS